MGSAAFLNEAVNQLSEAYLTRKQQELNQRIPHEEYRDALQQVKMHIADHNVYGVDLNPIAVELAEVSLWLNAISRSNVVPWFGYQLFNGNSLIGARRQVYRPDQLLTNKKEDKWYNNEPLRLEPQSLKMGTGRDPSHVYHFLLPDEGMAGVNDSEAKKLKPDAFEKIKNWKKQFIKPLTKDELKLLQQISGAVDVLWQGHTDMLRADRSRTEDRFAIWGQESDQYHTSTAHKDQIRATGIFNNNAKIASPYRRLKLVMDYWCALWFWPLDKADLLPDRSSWFFELNLLLQGQVYSFEAEQSGFDFDSEAKKEELFPVVGQQDLFDNDSPQLMLSEQEKKAQQVKTAKGELHLERLLEQFPRLKLVNDLTEKYKFFHWELSFADVFADDGGFDIMLGNPPWIMVSWNEKDFYSEVDPSIVIRKISASELKEKIDFYNRNFPNISRDYLAEVTRFDSSQNFLKSSSMYPLLQGQKNNLYKNFLISSWWIVNNKGAIGLIHEDGFLSSAGGGPARQEIFKRLISRFHFQNEKLLFAEVGHEKNYSLNVYSPIPCEVGFISISNLYHPVTIDQCLDKNSKKISIGIKDNKGNWNLSGCNDRIIFYNKESLGLIANVFDSSASTPLDVRLPEIQAYSLLNAIKKVEDYHCKFESFGDEVVVKQLFDENAFQKKGLITKEKIENNNNLKIWSPINIYVSNPAYKTFSKLRDEYVTVDMSADNFIACPEMLFSSLDDIELNREAGTCVYSTDQYSQVYKLALREMVSASRERTLIPAIIPKNSLHINTIVSIAFKDIEKLLLTCGMFSSLPLDFIVKSTGVGHIKRWLIGVSGEGHIVQPVKVRSRLTDSSLVAWEAPWRESKTVKPSDNVHRGCTATHQVVTCSERSSSLVTRTPVAETVDNARRQQGPIEMSPRRRPSPAGYQRRHDAKDYVATGETLGTRRGKPVEEVSPITVSGKGRRRYQGGGSGRSTADRRAAKRAGREGPGPVGMTFVQSEVGVR